MKHHDEIAAYNQERWNAIVRAGSEYTRPYLDMMPQLAQEEVNNYPTLVKGNMTQLAGKDVLCLAGSGGQQTAVFGLLGANVTVLDISDAQLANDKLAAEYPTGDNSSEPRSWEHLCSVIPPFVTVGARLL